MILDDDWSISVQLTRNKSAKCVTTVQKVKQECKMCNKN